MHDALSRSLAVAILLTLAGAERVSAQSTRAPTDSVQIVAELAALDSAWHAGDADAWVAHYASDADFVGFVNISGTRMTDRATLRDRLARIFAGMFRGSRHAGTLQRLRFLGADVAVADEDIEITGFTALPAGVSATAPGVLRTRMRHVLVRRGARWLIVASQNTAVAP